MLFQIILWALIVFMMVRMIITYRQQNKARKIIDAIRIIDDEEKFFPLIDKVKGEMKDPIYKTKADIIKLWGIAFHQHYDEFETQLSAINPDLLLKKKGDGYTISPLHEDSFFYLYLAIPNILYRYHRNDLIDKMNNTLASNKDQISNQLIIGLSDACNDYYFNRKDKGFDFFKKLIDGDYAGYVYSKTLIGLYKDIANAMLAKIYQETNDTDGYESTKDLLESFSETRVGARWLESISLKVEEKHVDDEPEENEESNNHEDNNEDKQ